MIELTLAPSLRLKTVAHLARWSLAVILIVWLVFLMTWGALQWFIVPRIGDFRLQLENRATQVLGVPVRIGAISAHSSGMIPSFELSNVQLFDGQGRVALELPRVLAAVSPHSLWHLGFEQLYVDRPTLSMRRDRNGKILVAGLDFSKSRDGGQGLADWFFSQAEFVIHAGTIEWIDELRSAPRLSLEQVELVVRNSGRSHNLRLDATPSTLWGERFSLVSLFRQPLLARHNGQWQDWVGQVYGAFPRVDLSELRRYADLGIDLHQGNGAVRAWADISNAKVAAATADIALARVSVSLGAAPKAIELQSVSGRLAGQRLANGFELSTQALAFDTSEGLHWPGGNFSVMYMGGEGSVPAHGEFTADKLDLAALTQIADKLPIDETLRAQLLANSPKGLVERIEVNWQGRMGELYRYRVKGLVSQLEVSAQAVVPVAPGATGEADRALAKPVSMSLTPGLRGARIEFDFDQSSGKASVSMADGAIELPAIFDEALIPVAQLATDVRWQIRGQQLAVQLPNLRFSNADAQGEARIKWQTSDPAKAGTHSAYPGVLDLEGSLSRADGTRVHRYLPLIIHKPVRDYVRDSVVAGTANGVKFKVKGDLSEMPFTNPKQGEFRISANVQNATYVYVPRNIQPPDALPWPALTSLTGELVFERAQMEIRGASARAGINSGLQIDKVEALIPDLKHSTVTVNAQIHGPLTEALTVINGSPIGAMVGQALRRTAAGGVADYQLKLNLPIATIAKSTVQGSVTLLGNDIQMTPATPRLMRSRGVVNFSQSGFSIVGGQARMLGGDVRLEGGSLSVPGGGVNRLAPSVMIRASGTASAEGLRQAKELGFLARLAQNAQGSAAYSAALGFRGGEPELSVTSNLQGLALSLPAPMTKSAETVLPFRLETALLRDPIPTVPGAPLRLRDQLTISLGRVASLVYVRDLSGGEPRVLRGSLAVGLGPQELAPMPDEGVLANINLQALDLDAWARVLSQVALTSPVAPAGAAPRRPDVNSDRTAAWTYLPTSVAVRAQELSFGGRKFNRVVVGGSRVGSVWRANLDASELNGYVEYRQSNGSGEGRVYARLARLTMAPGVASEIEALLNGQPASIPSLDIVVDDFELRGKRLGRMEVQAVNRSALESARESGVREWRLNKFNLTTPEAVLTATGNWAGLNAQSGAVAGAKAAPDTLGRRRTVLNFKLDINDAGALLARLGMKEVVRKGRGKMEGQVAWVGSPLTFDYATMEGAFAVNVEAGQFLKSEPGIAKLLGVLSLQSLPRRLTLDFRDVFSQGFSFDFLRGDVTIDQGIAKINNLQMKGVNAAVLMEGSADLAKETQDIRVVVVPELNAGTASLITTVINPAIGISTFLAQLFFRQPLIEAATQEFHVDGSWVDPRITKVPHKR